jgi:hypothetical protein
MNIGSPDAEGLPIKKWSKNHDRFKIMAIRQLADLCFTSENYLTSDYGLAIIF